MSYMTLRPSNTLLPTNNALVALLMVLLGTLALAVSAKIQVPFYPVPITMQTYVVLFIGFAFGRRLAAITLLTYLLEGAVGLPVFATGAGLAYLVGPTGGYLFGFVVAATLCGWLAEQEWDRSIAKTALAAVLGLAVIFALGLAWLGATIGWDKPLLALGLMPFLPGEAAKLVLLALTMPLAWTISKRRM